MAGGKGGGCGARTLSRVKGLSLFLPPPPHLAWQVGLLPGLRQLPPPSQSPQEGWLLCRGKLCGMLLFSFGGPSYITRGEDLRILLNSFLFRNQLPL